MQGLSVLSLRMVCVALVVSLAWASFQRTAPLWDLARDRPTDKQITNADSTEPGQGYADGQSPSTVVDEPRSAPPLRFVVPALLLVLTVYGGWVARSEYAARRQRRALTAIEALGGRAVYDRQFDEVGGQRGRGGRSGASGRRHCGRIVAVHLGGTSIADEDLAHLVGLTELRSLYLGDTPITDGGLKHLEGLTRLRSLDLSNTNVTIAGLGRLTGLPNLERLDLTGTGVDAEGLDRLNSHFPDRSPCFGT